MPKYVEDLFGLKTDISSFLDKGITMPLTGESLDGFCEKVWNNQATILMTLPAKESSIGFIKNVLSQFFKIYSKEVCVFGINDFYWIISPVNEKKYLESFKTFFLNHLEKNAKNTDSTIAYLLIKYRLEKDVRQN